MARHVPAHRVTAWTTQPRDDETFLSWFARYSFLQDSTPQMFSRFLGIDRMPTSRSLWGVRSDDDTIDYLAAVSRNTVDALRAVEYGSRFGELTPLGQLETERWFVACWVRFCPLCFREDGYWRGDWEFGRNNVCLAHECLLVTGCPNCSAARRGMFDTRADKHYNPSTCHSCSYDFATTPAVDATAEQVATQRRIDSFAGKGTGWVRFEEGVRCLTACRIGVKASRHLSPFGLPLDASTTLAVATEALDAVGTSDAFEELLTESMNAAINLARSGVEVTPDIRPIVRKYMGGHGSRHTIAMSADGANSSLNSGPELPIIEGNGSEAAA